MPFDVAAVFDEDYLYFYSDLLNEDRSEREVELIWSLAGLRPGDRVLDLACGHGRLSNRLAARGASVVGLDLTATFLDQARQAAEAQHLEIEYIEGDMRAISRSDEFDVIVSWFTSYGYFADDVNRDVLQGVHEALRPRGRLLLELNNASYLMRNFLPAIVHRVGEDAMIDEHRYDAISSSPYHAHTHSTDEGPHV